VLELLGLVSVHCNANVDCVFELSKKRRQKTQKNTRRKKEKEKKKEYQKRKSERKVRRMEGVIRQLVIVVCIV